MSWADASDEVRTLGEAAIAALNTEDLDAFKALMAGDVQFTSMVAEAEGATFHGHEGIDEWWDTVRGAFEEIEWELLDVRGHDDRVVAHLRLTGTLSGVPVEQTMWQAVKRRGGKMTWWAFFRTEREALDAAGLRE